MTRLTASAYISQAALSGVQAASVMECLDAVLSEFEDIAMSITELLPKLQALPRDEKRQLIQLLIDDLAREEDIPLVEGGVSYPIWSPYQAYDAAAKMLKSLDESKGKS